MIDFEKFERDMGAFTFGQHQDFLNYVQLLEHYSYSFDNVREYVVAIREMLKKEQAQKLITDLSKRCEICYNAMTLLPVNISPGTMTDDYSQSVWFCSKCGESIYNKESVFELMKGGK